MQDRLSEIQDGLERPESKDEEAAQGEEEIEGGDEFMKGFFEEVNSIRSGMAVIRRNVKSIEELTGQAIVAVGKEQNPKSGGELEKLIEDTNVAAKNVRNKLKEMEKKNKQQKPGTAQARIQTNVHGTLTKKFLELMTKYQEVQTTYKNKFRERVGRHIKIVNPDATEEEIDEALESGNTQVFADEILRHGQAKEALQYIQHRHEDIIKLEQSIQELHQLFMDMAILVETQGELIDQIEYNVNQSVAFSKEAAQQLQEAAVLQRKSRKKMCILIVILIVILLVLAVVGSIVIGVVAG